MNPGYTVVSVVKDGKNSILTAGDSKVMIFDTPQMAKEFLPLLGNGRICHQSEDRETATFSPIEIGGINKAQVLTGYDVFNTPPNTVPSEVKGLDWKYHIHWVEALAK